MLIGQASINLSANILSAVLGLLSVFVFTRLFSPDDYGIYLLGVGFASVISVFLAGWFRNLILNGHARNDGTDVRGVVISGYLICCLAAPIAYGLGRLVGLDASAALAAVVLSVAIGLYELTQDLVRARLMALTVMKATLVRAASVLGLGVVIAFLSPAGFLLLLSSALAYVIAVLVQSRAAWRGTVVAFDGAGLAAVARQGLPLTLSLTLLAVSSVTDRFMIANLVGAADAGRYVAGLDLVRQTLMMPAMSAAAAFFPLAVQIHAKQGNAALRSHLAECVELLLSITLPACLGFAVISSHVANAVLGADFREVAAQAMPIVAVAVIFQVLTQQYLHASFLLSGRNSLYLINTASIIAGQCDPVLRSREQPRHRRRRVGPTRRRRHWICLRLDPQPLGVSRSNAPWPACADADRRTGDGAGGRNARQKPACFGSDRLRRPRLRCIGELRGDVLAARHLPDPPASETRAGVFQNQACQHQHRIRARE